MTYKNFAAVPPGSICRPVTKQFGDEYYFLRGEAWSHVSLKWSEWNGRWETKKTNATAKRADAKSKAKGEPRK